MRIEQRRRSQQYIMDPLQQNVDWQITRHQIKTRAKHLLETETWADCHFLIGTEPNKQIIAGHKLILAMASPVFQAMFYGGLPEKNDPIPILDVQPDAFKALLEYIYTDTININSVEKACELCYGAKKYMLPYVVEQCTKYLWSDLKPKNACRAYEFAKLFEEPRLMEKCLQMICTQTLEVVEDVSFEDIEVNTLMVVLDQDVLNVNSELDLFYALSRYADKHSVDVNRESEESIAEDQNNITMRDAIRKIRFLSLTPQQFAEGPGRSNLLSQSDAFAILMKISSTNSAIPFPEGFSMLIRKYGVEPSDSPAIVVTPDPSTSATDIEVSGGGDRKYYCIRTIRQHTDCFNTSVLDCSVTFSVDRCICITGVQVPTQGEISMVGVPSANMPDRYSELLYAHLLDSQGSRLTYTHCTSRVRFDSMLEISFDRPVFIQRNKMYKVGVVFNKVGSYRMATYRPCIPTVTCDGVCFTFGVGAEAESVRDGLIRAIVFSYPRESV